MVHIANVDQLVREGRGRAQIMFASQRIIGPGLSEQARVDLNSMINDMMNEEPQNRLERGKHYAQFLNFVANTNNAQFETFLELFKHAGQFPLNIELVDGKNSSFMLLQVGRTSTGYVVLFTYDIDFDPIPSKTSKLPKFYRIPKDRL